MRKSQQNKNKKISLLLNSEITSEMRFLWASLPMIFPKCTPPDSAEIYLP